jgi:calcineurin-like phosphoesterase family protein
MKVFVTADTHFHHLEVIHFSKRPFKSVNEMNQTMIERWNNKVSNNDLVFHLGDFAHRISNNKIKEIKDQLNGTIILVPGNHDRRRIMKKFGFVVAGYTLKVGNLLMSHHPMRVRNGLINVHGHLHQWKSQHGLNACVDVNNFEPVPIEWYFKEAERMLGGNGKC